MKNKTFSFLALPLIVVMIVILLAGLAAASVQIRAESKGRLYVNGQNVPAFLAFEVVNGTNYVEIPFLSSLEALGYLVEKKDDTVAVWDIEGNTYVSDLSLYERGGFYNINSQHKSDEIFPAVGQDWGYRAVRDGDIYLDQLSLRTTLSELGINARVIVDFPNKRVDILG